MDTENQKVQEKNEAPRSSIRTMLGDVQEYAKSKKFSLGELVAERERRTSGPDGQNLTLKIRPWVYVFLAALILILVGSGAFLLRKAPTSEEVPGIAEPKPIVAANRESVIKIQNLDQKTFSNEWKKLLESQFLPRELVYVKIFDSGLNEYLEAQDFFKIIGASVPPLLFDALSGRITASIIDTSRGNEPVLILEINSYSSAFAGLLSWEKNVLDGLRPLLKTDLSYERDEGVFKDSVVANNDARLLQNTLDEPILGYSIFNRKFLVIAQSPQALEIIIRQMSVLPPR